MITLSAQQEVFAFYQELSEFLGKHAALFWGNLLGAVRHGGFIPWDDDFDLLMARSEIPQLISFCQSRGIKVVHHSGHFLKLYHPDGAICRPEMPWRWPAIDVFPYDIENGELITRFLNTVVRLPVSQVLPFRPILFEGQSFLSVACPLAVLKALFGDYDVYRIKLYDHRTEQNLSLDDIVERVNSAHWQKSQSSGIQPASSFAEVAGAFFSVIRGPILDLGSGDGRDTRYFKEMGFSVDPCDLHVAERCDALTVELAEYRQIYCRWLLHTLSLRQRQRLLARFQKVMPGTIICFEFRDLADRTNLTAVLNDPRLYFDDGHFRWLMTNREVLDALGSEFSILHQSMGRYSPTTASDPILSRLIIKKM